LLITEGRQQQDPARLEHGQHGKGGRKPSQTRGVTGRP
jgi:hypothetical protein